MALNPQCKAFLDQLAAGGGPPLHELPPAQARGLTMPPELGGPETPLHRVETRTIPGPAGPVAVRVYAPVDAAPLPGLIFFHGGGMVLGGLEMADRQCRDLAAGAGCVVVSVDYRLAPEHPFPAAVDDAYAATAYVGTHPDEFGVRADRLAVGGESAGGNLAAVTTILARDRHGPRLIYQLLVYPQVDFDDDRSSLREFDGYFLSRPLLDYFAAHYLPDRAARTHPLASPLRAPSLAGLPPAYIITAECDPLRDQGEAYAAALTRAGVDVRLERFEGMIHPFFSLAGIIDGGRRAIAAAAAALQDGFDASRVP